MISKKQIRLAALGITVACVLAFWFLASQSQSSAAQGSPDRIWNEVDASRLIAPAGTQVITPAKFRAVAIDTSLLKIKLARAPMEFTPAAIAGRVEISLPKPDGGYAR